ncbi:MAG TPA: SDR family oxidoreductase [Anaerolineae bacterium]|nr:SDR family oxidoreductase [Anaerolineae bacterium]
MRTRLLGKTALITGGTSGIGEATARVFAAESAKVAIMGRRRELGERVISQIRQSGGEAIYIESDVTRSIDCSRAIDETLAAFGRIDILFNNAGIVAPGTLENTSEADWDRSFEVNVKGVYLMTHAIIPVMRRQGGGVIINNASDWGIVGGPGYAAYSATKGAVVLMTKTVALEVARENIRVNAICPGDTFVERWRTDEWHNQPEDMEATLKAMGEALPIGRVGNVDEIANSVLFLASDDSSFMTGASLIVDGGNTAR